MNRVSRRGASGRIAPRLSSLRFRLVLVVLGISSVLIAISMFADYFLLRSMARDRSEDAAESISTLLAHSVAAGLDFDLRRSVRETLAGVFRIDDVSFAVVYDAEGEPYEALGSRPGHELPTEIPERIEVTWWDDHLVAHAPILDTSGRRLGVLHLGYSLEEMQANLNQLVWLLLLSGLAFALIGALGARELGGRLVAPILALARAARSFADGRFERPLPVRGNDEVGVVTEAFNEMAARLQKAHRELEEKVRERTAELNEKNVELARQNEKALEASRLKSEFLANMSHELRTPLNAILALSELLRDEVLGPLPNEEQKRQVAMIHRSGENLLRMINEVLDLSKIEAGRMEIDYQHVEIQSEIENTVLQMKGLAVSKGLEFRFIPEGEGRVWVDPGRVRQIFTNLLGNAIKFTEHGSVEVRSRLETEQESLVLEVRDTGIGIDSKDHGRVFQEFRQVDGSVTRRFGGTGLGLAISRRLARLMGGDVTLDSQLGKGSVFRLEIPAHATKPEPAPAIDQEDSLVDQLRARMREEREAGTPAPAGELGTGSYGCILVVDDDETLQQALSRYLVSHGFEVQIAGNGREALEEMQRCTPDLMILDLMMPGMSGFEVIDALRGDDGRARVPVVVYTAKELSPAERRDLQRSVVKVLRKEGRGIRMLVEDIEQIVQQREAA
ncbi:MAG: response regulator [Candidatus Eisenbacteria bacterium]|nr:response regulator [Candidatus Latescibacterota bacterium]MBD3301790.1 response regulator [Candidatus Eisenbacteria bacterium]